MAESTLANIQQELSSIRNAILAAQNTLKTGQMPQVNGLEEQVAVLCKLVQSAPKESQETCLADMKDLLKELDVLAAGMKEWMLARSLPT